MAIAWCGERAGRMGVSRRTVAAMLTRDGDMERRHRGASITQGNGGQRGDILTVNSEKLISSRRQTSNKAGADKQTTGAQKRQAAAGASKLAKNVAWAAASKSQRYQRSLSIAVSSINSGGMPASAASA